MRVVIALGGNALLRRGEILSAENQRRNIRIAAKAIFEVIQAGHDVIVTHGNGPQVGLLALQDAAEKNGPHFPLDVLCAETAGMIGYVLEQELTRFFSPDKMFATLLTQVEVDASDQALLMPTKPIGPIYQCERADALAKTSGWTYGKDGDDFRRLVASPMPKKILGVAVIKLLLQEGVTVICAGGGGIPVVRDQDGKCIGIEAVIDKDRTSALLATQVDAHALLMLTDVEGVFRDWGKPEQALISRLTLEQAKAEWFASGSMAPKVEAAADFVRHGGKLAGIGLLKDASVILKREAGTVLDATGRS